MNTSPFSSTPFSPIVSAPFGSSNPFNRSKIAGLQRFTWSSSNHVPFLRHWNAKMRLLLRFVHKFSWELDSFFFFCNFRNSSILLLLGFSYYSPRSFDDNLRSNNLLFRGNIFERNFCFIYTFIARIGIRYFYNC